MLQTEILPYLKEANSQAVARTRMTLAEIFIQKGNQGRAKEEILSSVELLEDLVDQFLSDFF